MLDVMVMQRLECLRQPNTLMRVERRDGIDHGFHKFFRPDHGKDKGTGISGMVSQ